jgi:hypothetical protein
MFPLAISSCLSILCLRTFGIVTADEVLDELQLSATHVSESNPDPLFLVCPDHNTGHVYSQLSTGKPERQPDGGAWWQGTSHL